MGIPSRLQIKTLDELEVEETHFASGGFGNVHRGKFHGQHVAVKRLNGAFDLEVLAKELRMWSRLTHPNIVQLMGYTEPPLTPMIVMELMERSLFNVLQNNDVPLSLLRRVEIAHDLASGVSYLHGKEGVHRDIKSLNVLVRGTDIKLADFGSARGLESLSLTTAGSMRWNAPEVFDGEAASQASDVYAMGVTFSEIFTRGVPYADLIADAAVMRAVFKGTRPQLWPPTVGMQELLIGGGGDLAKQTKGFRLLIQKCWDKTPAKRPAAREVRVELASLLSQTKVGLTPSHPIPSSPASSEEPKVIPMPMYSFSTLTSSSSSSSPAGTSVSDNRQLLSWEEFNGAHEKRVFFTINWKDGEEHLLVCNHHCDRLTIERPFKEGAPVPFEAVFQLRCYGDRMTLHHLVLSLFLSCGKFGDNDAILCNEKQVGFRKTGEPCREEWQADFNEDGSFNLKVEANKGWRYAWRANRDDCSQRPSHWIERFDAVNLRAYIYDEEQ